MRLLARGVAADEIDVTNEIIFEVKTETVLRRWWRVRGQRRQRIGRFILCRRRALDRLKVPRRTIENLLNFGDVLCSWR